MVLSDGMVHFLKIKIKKKKNLPKLSCGFNIIRKQEMVYGPFFNGKGRFSMNFECNTLQSFVFVLIYTFTN